MILEIPSAQTVNAFNWSTLFTILGTLFAAGIAGWVALYQVKLNVLSSASINWMDNLRNSISEYCALTGDILIAIKNLQSNVNKYGSNNYPEFRSDYDKYANLCSRHAIQRNKVFLYLNSENEFHKKIENTIDIVNNILANNKIENIVNSEIMNYQNDIVALAKLVFKHEWQKAKKVI